MDRKYYIAPRGIGKVQYEWGHKGMFKFTTTYDKYYSMLIYEEDGKFYEFLTGEFLGTRKKSSKGNIWEIVFSSEYGDLFVLHRLNSCSDDAYSLTAEKFAEYAQSDMKYKDKIIPYLEKRFDEWRDKYQEELEAENKKKYVEAKSKAEAESWIDNMLNNRK